MKTLPHQLTYHGHDLTLIERTDHCGLWSTRRDGESTPGWIVAKIGRQHEGEAVIGGRTVKFEDAETMPSPSDFGSRAWFFRSESNARTRYGVLCAGLESSLTRQAMSGQGLPITTA